MSKEYLISGTCKVLTVENYPGAHSVKGGLMSTFYVNGEHLMCKVIQTSTTLDPGAEGEIQVSLLVINSAYIPKAGDYFELREGMNILAKCQLNSVVLNSYE